MLNSEHAQQLSTDAINEMMDIVSHHRIEMYERPSVDGSGGAHPKSLDFQREFEKHEYRIFAASGANQCLAEGTLVATPGGPRAIESLVEGDMVYGPDGRPIRVLETFYSGERECYQFTNRKIPLVDCTLNHVFLTRRPGRGVRQICAGAFQKDTKIRRVEFNAPLGPVHEPHAYAIGALLGDGCCREASRGLSISSGTDTVPDAVAQVLGGAAKRRHPGNYTYVLDASTCNHYEEWMRGKYAHEKTVNLEQIKQWDRKSLLAFVAGLIDTDGSVYLDQWDTVCVCVSMQALPVVEAVQYAFLALWQVNTNINTSRADRYVNGPVYELAVRNNAYSLRMLRELDPHLQVPHKKWRPEYEGLTAERTNGEWMGAKRRESRMVNTYDIHVESAENLYLLANGLVTHNSGKTVAVAGLCFCKHVRDVAKDGDVYWVIASSHETMRDIPHKSLWEFLPRHMFPKNVEYSPRLGFGMIPTLHMTLPEGRGKCEIWFKTEEQELRAFESSRVNGVWWTECKRDVIFDALQPRLVARRGWMLMDYVPVEGWHKFRIRIPAELGSKTIYHMRYSMHDNAHNLAPNAIPEAREQLTEREARVRIDGEDGSEFGIVYMEFDPRYHTCQPFQIPNEWPRYRCMDYGYRNPTAMLWAAICPSEFVVPESKDWERPLHPNQERLIIYREFYNHGLTVPEIAGAIRKLSGDEKYGYSVADPTMWNLTQTGGPVATSIADEFAKHHLVLRQGARTQSMGEHARVAKVRHWFENDKIIIFDTCVNTIREHQSWRYKEDKDGKAPGNEAFVDSDNHTCDALKYLLAENLTYYKPGVRVRTYAA